MTICAHCGTRPGTIDFLPGGGGVLAIVHGLVQKWCERCVVEVQLAHAREAAARIHELEAAWERLR